MLRVEFREHSYGGSSSTSTIDGNNTKHRSSKSTHRDIDKYNESLEPSSERKSVKGMILRPLRLYILNQNANYGSHLVKKLYNIVTKPYTHS
jgi:hypothetical protein